MSYHPTPGTPGPSDEGRIREALRDARREVRYAVNETLRLDRHVGTLLTFVLWLLRVPCGHFGGARPDVPVVTLWCTKRFGHRDRHSYQFGPQPLDVQRLTAQGWFNPRALGDDQVSEPPTPSPTAR